MARHVAMPPANDLVNIALVLFASGAIHVGLAQLPLSPDISDCCKPSMVQKRETLTNEAVDYHTIENVVSNGGTSETLSKNDYEMFERISQNFKDFVEHDDKIWDDCNAHPLVVFKPHDGQPVYVASFTMPSHVLLLTVGPLNREVKIWSSTSEEGWLLPSDIDAWKCTQTLELKSSTKSRHDDAFFNQLVALPQAGFFLLANAKKNAICDVHIEYGSNPAANRMDCIAEFTVTMHILSFTAAKVESVILERSDSNLSLEAKNTEGIIVVDPRGTKPIESPRWTRKSSSFRSVSNSFEPSSGFSDHVNQPAIEYSVDRHMNNELRNDDNNISLAINPPNPRCLKQWGSRMK
ncbi:hypothetical protein ACFE04_026398 [Oxalis oulophora]